jgi:hypothetical protein
MRKAVTMGLFLEADVDARFKTAYRVLFRAGLFDPPELVPWTKIGLDQYGSDKHWDQAHDAALHVARFLKRILHSRMHIWCVSNTS